MTAGATRCELLLATRYSLPARYLVAACLSPSRHPGVPPPDAQDETGDEGIRNPHGIGSTTGADKRMIIRLFLYFHTALRPSYCRRRKGSDFLGTFPSILPERMHARTHIMSVESSARRRAGGSQAVEFACDPYKRRYYYARSVRVGFGACAD
ncbi:uncharacterized protein BO80DRAFT_176877 [Aspergillus ibericus CBS 121593]|uniref:Uncharacterized protein n=1 Tax=Aspergillus ibericus CBS 121593 TaxID=1448316 RepID=A0A395HB07_9EURO|nr:hypothetical protein BO80DRAFT_176877 [Aspergillus ibericus CBS 121593]RAL05097.1 hypothetical protein BO80DRAFT_176877 [Aspergillus ibericus CBS 121593]